MANVETHDSSQNQEYTISSVKSADGTEIGYRKYGAGPAIVLVQAAIRTTHGYHDLASDLKKDFTVYVPERRGRPLSPRQYASDHCVDREVEDLAAIIERSGADVLFGLSSGAVIALEAARTLTTVRKLVIYEPPLYVPPQQMRFDLVDRFHREVEAENLPAAMVTALITTELAPPFLPYVPRLLLEPALALYLRWESPHELKNGPPLRELVPAMRYDFKVVSSMQNRFESFKTISADTLLLSCVKSVAYLRQSCAVLDLVLPNSRRQEFDELDHSGPWNSDLGGKPLVVAAAIRDFLNA